jgi:hypothetical protein
VKGISPAARTTLAKIMLELAPDENNAAAAAAAEGVGSSSSQRRRRRRRSGKRWWVFGGKRGGSQNNDGAGEAIGGEAEDKAYVIGGVNPRVNMTALTALALELGVVLRPGAAKEGPAATAMWLFDGSVDQLPGGYSSNELSPDSPVKELASFPQELVLVGRNTILIKGVAARLNLDWSLAKEWVPIARRLLRYDGGEYDEDDDDATAGGGGGRRGRRKGGGGGGGRGLVRRVKSRAERAGTAAMMVAPAPVRRSVAAALLRVTEWREARRSRRRR